MLWIILAIIIALADQLSKYIVMQNVQLNQMIPVIDKFFYLTYIRNPGAAFSLLLNGRLFFLILTPIVFIVLIYFLIKSKSAFLKTSLAMILGGAAGNYVDRLFVGSVTDFFSFYFGSHPFAIFNLGDSAITVGTILLAIYLLFLYKDNTTKPGSKGDKDKELKTPEQVDTEQENAE